MPESELTHGRSFYGPFMLELRGPKHLFDAEMRRLQASRQMLEALRKADTAFSHDSMEMMGGLWPMTRAAVRAAIAAAEEEQT